MALIDPAALMEPQVKTECNAQLKPQVKDCSGFLKNETIRRILEANCFGSPPRAECDQSIVVKVEPKKTLYLRSEFIHH